MQWGLGSASSPRDVETGVSGRIYSRAAYIGRLPPDMLRRQCDLLRTLMG